MMNTYLDDQTKAYFCVQSLDLLKEADYTKPHPWFTILIVNKLVGDLFIDEFPLKNPISSAIFITPGQHFLFSYCTDCVGYSISFNKEFYCIEYHDSEVSCNGLLFVNNFDIVHVSLDEQQETIYNNTVKEMCSECCNEDPLKAEMLKNLLKNLLIRSSRLFRTQHAIDDTEDQSLDFARKFSRLVEAHYKEKKQVEDYSEILGISAGSLTKKLQKIGVDSPSRIIKNRLLTEAKRLLLYTDKSIKEISYHLGYDDQHYFSRLFTKETGLPPTDYKRKRCLTNS